MWEQVSVREFRRFCKAVLAAWVLAVLSVSVYAGQDEGRLVLVAHAGGAVEGYAGSNSLEAMRESAALGFRYIELDMLTSSCERIVLTHDWHHYFNRVPKGGVLPVTHAEFMARPIFDRFTPVDLSGLIEFLEEHPDVRIITDTKDTAYAALHAIVAEYPEFIGRFVVQVYAFEDVAYVRGLGFEDVLLTVYMMPYHLTMRAAEIAAFAAEQGLWGVVVPDEIVTEDYAYRLRLGEVRGFVHTIDTPERAALLQGMGFTGIYTGFLTYDAEGELVSRFAGHGARLQDLRMRSISIGRDPVQRAVLSGAVLYRAGEPVYMHKGRPTEVSSDLAAAPFISSVTGEMYIPAHHFNRYMTGREWDRAQMRLSMTVGGTRAEVRAADAYELVMYRDMVYVPISTIARIFGYQVVADGGYAVLVPNGHTWTQAEVLGAARSLFRQ